MISLNRTNWKLIKVTSFYCRINGRRKLWLRAAFLADNDDIIGLKNRVVLLFGAYLLKVKGESLDALDITPVDHDIALDDLFRETASGGNSVREGQLLFR